MKYLLDTHCFVWMAVAPQRLNATAQAALRDGGNELYLSAASAWEVAIKQAIGKLTLPEPPEAWVLRQMRALDLLALPIQPIHALRTAQLPSQHRDPFDRLLVSQALIEGLTLVTADEQLRAYPVPLLWAV